MLDKIIRRAENNIYAGISLKNGTIVFAWALLGLFLMGRSTELVYGIAFSMIYYIVLLAIGLLIFRDIGSYLAFPGGYNKLDILFIYPVILTAATGVLSNALTASGILAVGLREAAITEGADWSTAVRVFLLPLAVYSEEFLNLLLVSFIFKYVKLPGKLRLAGSIAAASLAFGALHAVGQGPEAAVVIGISYIPMFVATLFTGNIWPSFLAHLYNDLIAFSKNYNGSLHYAVIAAIVVLPVLWAVWVLFRKQS